MNTMLRTQSQIAEIQLRAVNNHVVMARVYGNQPRPVAGAYAPIHRAIVAGDIDAVRSALTPTTVNMQAVGHLTPLHLAVFGYAKAARSIEGMKLEAAGHRLVEEQIVDLLIAAGAEVAAWDQEKRLPAACCEGVKMPASLRRAMDQKILDSTETLTLTGIQFNAFCTRGELITDLRV